MIRKGEFILAAIGILFLIAACNKNSLVDKQTMANAYVDILIVKDEFQSNNDSLLANQKKVFKNYGITEKNYDATLKSYKFDQEVWKDFFKTVYARIDSLQSKKSLLAKSQLESNKK